MDKIVAYRGDKRWAQIFEPMRLDDRSKAVRSLRENGVYWITGGLGGVGLLLAEYLAKTVRARLVLTGRTGLPPRNEWHELLAGPDDDVTRKIRKVLALEQLGAEVMVEPADVSDEAQMQSIVERIYTRYNQLNGVLHAAGVTAGSSLFVPISELSPAEYEMQFQPKAYGVYVLESILAGKNLDFCILFSSNASVLGGLGFVTYSAANSFMDAFASSRRETGSFPWISASWDPWPEETKKVLGVQTSMDRYTMTAQESAEAFRRAVTAVAGGHVVIATGNLGARYDLWIRQGSAPSASVTTAHPRPKVRSTYVSPRNETEKAIADVWQRLLGIEQAGIHDNFFDLGGHSLLATKVVAQLRDTLQVDLPLRKLFENPTIAGLSQYIIDLQIAREEEEKKRILVMLSQLSEEEVELEINRRAATD
jgi:NAD(P)-dependent dehydrogenase (short-subunit alcohol dehydrogenase family)/acyl carrier protein